ncbi:hypothetical protein [Acidimangrovimonas sediminis]|uniref:hypothetical protein n=1 Tax=Acidimangrovimonas sediminis TaxID=2056283 RepID=UPI000C80C29F|nr:hypothetical protein [Acidimangrovimonas sediminis]
MSESAHIAEAGLWDARIWQAVIAGAVVAFGWWVNGWQNRRAAAARRAERLRDVHRALFAEIGAHLANLGGAEALDLYADRMVSRMEADPAFIPFIPHEANDRVFGAVVADIHILPRSSIDPVVAYYSQIASVAALARDMRGVGFRGLEQPRRIAIYRDYIEMKKQAFAFGDYALTIIDAYAKGGRDGALRAEAAERARAGISTPGADRSGR